MAARRRSDATMTILIMGLGAIGLFGGVVVYYSRQTPILRLKPVLEQRYQLGGFETRFVSGPSPWIEVVPPAGLALPDEYARMELGVFALTQYRELTEQRTGVTECRVLSPDGGLEAMVDTEMCFMLEAARGAQAQQLELLRRAGLEEPQVALRGVVRSGVHMEARGRGGPGASQEERERLARKAAASLGGLAYVSKVRVEVLGPGDASVSAEAGRDVPRAPRRKPPPRRPPGDPAPVGTGGEAPVETRSPPGG